MFIEHVKVMQAQKERTSVLPGLCHQALSSLCFSFLSFSSLQESWVESVKPLYWDFPGRPVVRTLLFHCRVLGFNPWSRN